MIKLDGNRKEVLRYLGYGGQSLSPEMEGQLDLVLKQGLSLAAPRSVYSVFDAEKTDGGLLLKNTDLILSGENINSHLSGAERVAVMAVTIGIRIENAISAYERTGEITKAMILDAVGTALVEELADKVNAEIENEAERNGFYCKTRFSPGYGDFPLETQKMIMPILGCEKRIGVTLSDTLLMTPRKSVTAVIGFFKGEGTE